MHSVDCHSLMLLNLHLTPINSHQPPGESVKGKKEQVRPRDQMKIAVIECTELH